MFYIQVESNFSTELKIAYNLYEQNNVIIQQNEKIIEELKKLNSSKVEEDIPQYTCKTCGKVYANKGELLNCAKKHKKKG